MSRYDTCSLSLHVWAKFLILILILILYGDDGLISRCLKLVLALTAAPQDVRCAKDLGS